MQSFQQVECVDHQDCLAGKPLVNGERVIVRWSDGTSSTHVVEVVDGRVTGVIEVGDVLSKVVMGGDSLSYVKVRHKGFDLRIGLRDSGLTLVREE